MGEGYGSGLSAWLTDRPKRRSLNLRSLLFPVLGVLTEIHPFALAMGAPDDVDTEVARIQGLAEVLYEVAMEWPELSKPDPLANSILSLISTIKDDMGHVDQFRRKEWRLHKQVETVSSSIR